MRKGGGRGEERRGRRGEEREERGGKRGEGRGERGKEKKREGQKPIMAVWYMMPHTHQRCPLDPVMLSLSGQDLQRTHCLGGAFL